MKKISVILLAGFILLNLISTVNAYFPTGGSCRPGDVQNPSVNYPDCITPKSTSNNNSEGTKMIFCPDGSLKPEGQCPAYKPPSQTSPSAPPATTPATTPTPQPSSSDVMKPIPTKNLQTGLYESGCNPGYHLTSTLNTGETICLKDGAPTPGAYEVKISTDTVKGMGTTSFCSINTYALKGGACNVGDVKVNCPPPIGIVCSKGMGAVGGTVHEYTMSQPIPCDPRFGSCPSAQTPAGYIARLYQFGLMIAGLAAFGSIVYGALQYVLSAGNSSLQGDAKDQITQAILGLVLLLGAYLILYTINPNLVNLQNPMLEFIDIEAIRKDAQPENTGEQRLVTGGGGGDPLCQTSINANIGVNATNIPGVSSGEKTSGPICLNCKENAHRVGAVLGVGGTCECDGNYAFDSKTSSCIKAVSIEYIKP